MSTAILTDQPWGHKTKKRACFLVSPLDKFKNSRMFIGLGHPINRVKTFWSWYML